MKLTMKNIITCSAAMAAVALVPCVARATIVGPYTTDADTLHLWHLDELGTPAADQAHYNYSGTFTVKPDANQPMNALFGTGGNVATLGNASFAGFGTALSTANVTQNPPYPANSVQPGLGALTPANGTADNVDHTFDNPTTHAFTIEAIIQIGFNPAANWAQPQEIVSGEGDAGDSSDRSWQFRIEANNSASTTPWTLRFQKVSGFGGVGGSTANYNLDASIPTTGINAIQQGGWYHVAVTYDGNLTDPNSLKLYWTKMDDANNQDNLLNSGNMNGWLREQDTDLCFGNEMRDFNGNTEPFIGLIDEVRISDEARTATDMMLVPEPASYVLMGLGGLASVFCLRRRK